LKTLAPIFFLLLFSVCQAGMGQTREKSVPHLLAGIATRTVDLNYITEQDSEVFAFYRNTSVKKIDESSLLALLRRSDDAQITRQAWSMFFEIRKRNDSTGGWAELQKYLEANLTDVVVFYLPRDPPFDSQYDLYAVGLFHGNTVVGVQMFGVAT
jgi:hypothetical protein